MIINFSVENFGSIKEKQTLSFLANKSDHLEDYYIIEPIKGLRLNKLALIYGANASGKTTVLKALDFIRKICTEPFDKKTEKFDFEPFLFDENTPKQNTKFELEFVQNGIRYFYEVELNKNCIVKEKLYNFNPNKALVFERNTDEQKELTSIKFGSKIPKRKTLEDNLEIFTLWNNTVLGGFLKANIESELLKNFLDLLKIDLYPTLSNNVNARLFITSIIANDIINKNHIAKFLKIADFNISTLIIKREKEFIPKSIIDESEFFIRTENGIAVEMNAIENNNVYFNHTVNGKNFTLPIDLESDGTQKYFELSGILGMLILGICIIPIDELESSLHPDLFNHFLLTYLVNGKKESQLIATTHNREILNNRDLFRDDAIWFTDKNEDSATELYSLADFDSSVVRDTTNVLNAYKSGKLGGVPNLGDYYINLDEE
ncbi:MAG: ATP-binding protein [Cloacibacterium sp.]|uniref:AAA family ATPase n=1 Tax=Cloacibacterium sp. TaxID=1913682 RepID=UPI003C74CF16